MISGSTEEVRNVSKGEDTILKNNSDNNIAFSFHDELLPDVFSAAICRVTSNKIEVKLP